MSACAVMGIDSTPMEGIVKEDYDKILDLKNYKTLFSVAIGYRHQEDPNQPTKKLKTRLNMDSVVSFIK